MKILKIILFTLVMIGTYSCQDPTYNGDYYIRNNSNQMLKIYLNNSRVADIAPIVLDIGDFKKYYYSDRTDAIDSPPPPFRADSLHVVYNDTVLITHFYEVTGQDVLRNMFSPDSWNSQLSEYRNQYDYIFTDADYEEALQKE